MFSLSTHQLCRSNHLTSIEMTNWFKVTTLESRAEFKGQIWALGSPGYYDQRSKTLESEDRDVGLRVLPNCWVMSLKMKVIYHGRSTSMVKWLEHGRSRYQMSLIRECGLIYPINIYKIILFVNFFSVVSLTILLLQPPPLDPNAPLPLKVFQVSFKLPLSIKGLFLLVWASVDSSFMHVIIMTPSPQLL